MTKDVSGRCNPGELKRIEEKTVVVGDEFELLLFRFSGGPDREQIVTSADKCGHAGRYEDRANTIDRLVDNAPLLIYLRLCPSNQE